MNGTNKKKYILVHGNLRKELKKIPQSTYDIILIDCPPNFTIVTKNTLGSFDLLLIPAKPNYLSICPEYL
jgi:chromosome partitioning protein